MDLDLLQDTERLAHMSDTLNLEDNANKYLFSPATHIMFLLKEYERLREYVKLQEKICCSYGIDGMLLPSDILKRMRDVLFYFGSHESATYMFCCLKAELCYEQEEFFDDIMRRVEERLASCSDATEQARLIEICFKIRRIYSVFQK
ncbi:hypothetical protein CEXT_178101 [Caerostris extrusa]|uniref:Uncharacterized protein n=1 Tax=Caerostris extrusa TaxID=172846 RepID=A0AAV4NVB0_CAEEX|nr:hypothetical protein CEXT_178101 [Caerostris extrusa]